ncbi:UDP-glucuronosyltransferase 1-2-like isoform 2-T2 [Clarias gariepinus]
MFSFASFKLKCLKLKMPCLLAALQLLLYFCSFLGPVEGGKVLVMPVDGSHWLSMKILVEELSQRGHEMVVLVPETSLLIRGSDAYTTRIFKVPFTKDELDDIMKNTQERFMKAPAFSNILENLSGLLRFTDMQVNACEALLYNEPLMQDLRDKHFDLMLTDPFLPCGPIIAEAFSLPVIYFLRGLPCGLDEDAAQCPAPPSYVPRLYDFTFEYPKPVMPNMVTIGGINCAKKKPLPAELEEFVEGSGDHGFIVFTLGSYMSEVPESKAQEFFKAFKQIPQKVLWRYTGPVPKDLPENVKLMKWLPQNDLLAHPKAKVFITHGGSHGTYEGICNGVPMVMIPLFGDQRDNVLRMVSHGVAESLNMYDLTSENLLGAVRRVITDKSYKEKIIKLSVIHKDRPIEPLDLAVFWVEFVMRHGGAAHLRPAAHNLNWVQYHSLDVISFLLLVLTVAVFITLKTCAFCFRKCFRRTQKTKKE